MLSGLQGTQYQPLSEDQVQTIHDASLKILEKTGVTYEQGLRNTVNMLEKAGAKIDRDQARLTLPPTLIEESIAQAPERIILYNRDGKTDELESNLLKRSVCIPKIRSTVYGENYENSGAPGGQYRPLSDKQVETIYEAALNILEKIGFTYKSGDVVAL